MAIASSALKAPRVTVGRHQFAIDYHGSGDIPILALHGIPGWRGAWRTVAARLKPEHWLIAPDLLGFGDSSAPIGDGHACEQAAALLALLDTLHLPRVHLVGFDFGGPTAVTIAAAAPERVLSLTVASANLFTDTPIPAFLSAASIPLLGPAIFRLLFGRLGLAMLWFAATGDKRAFPRRRYLEALKSAQGVRWTRQILLNSLRDLPGLYRHVETALPRISVPTTILWGDRDPFFALDQGRRVANVIPGARFIALPGCGHFVPEERPREVAEAIADVAR